MTDIPLPPNPVTFTEEAAEKVLDAMTEEGLSAETHGIRVGIMGGGCAGLQYLLDFHELAQENDYDFVYNQHSVTVVVDQFSAMHLTGTSVEYIDSLHGSGFKFVNPNMKRACGCGASVGY